MKLIGALLITGLFVYFIYNFQDSVPTESTILTPTTTVLSSHETVENKKVIAGKSDGSTNQNQLRKERVATAGEVPEYTDEDMERLNLVNNWRRKEGYRTIYYFDSPFPKDEPHSYDIYDIESLTAMSESDPLAKLFLARKLWKNGENEQAKLYLEESAVNGYTSALTDLIRIHIDEGDLLNKSGNAEGADNAFIEAIAWSYVVNFRFRPDDIKLPKPYALKSEPNRLKELTEEAEIRGMKIYSDLKLKRLESGLGDFDNDKGF